MNNGVTVFVCGVPKKPCTTTGCGNPATSSCTFELRGKKAGTKCSRAICDGCNKEGLCVSHKRLVDASAR
jgi:hypothetical protein